MFEWEDAQTQLWYSYESLSQPKRGTQAQKLPMKGTHVGQKRQAPNVNVLSYWLGAFQKQRALTKMLLQIQRLCSLWLSTNFCP